MRGVGVAAGHQNLGVTDAEQGGLERLGGGDGEGGLGAGGRFDQAVSIRDGKRRTAGKRWVKVTYVKARHRRGAKDLDGVLAAAVVAAEDAVTEVAVDGG